MNQEILREIYNDEFDIDLDDEFSDDEWAEMVKCNPDLAD